MKALILAGGRGSRLDADADAENKCLLRLFGKPLVFYSLCNAVRAGAHQIIVVVGFRAHRVMELLGSEFQGVEIRYVHQGEPGGVVDAMVSARAIIGLSDFLLFLGDEIVWHPKHGQMVHRFRERDLFAVCGVVGEDDPAEISKTYSIVESGHHRRISRLIEKPAHSQGGFRGTGNCVFKAKILDYARVTSVSPHRGEKELPDLIQCAIDDGCRIDAFDIGAGYANINTVEDVESAIAMEKRFRKNEQIIVQRLQRPFVY